VEVLGALLGEVLEDKAYYEEIDGYRDAEDAERCEDAVHANPEEEVKESQLEEIVENMGACKSGSVARVGMFTEGEMGREVVIGEEADDIAEGEGDVDIDEVLQQPVNSVVDGNGQHTNDSEAEDLTKRLSFEQIFDFHGAKIVILFKISPRNGYF